MDEFEKREILEEFLVRWNGGASTKTIAQELVAGGRNPSDVAACKRLFEKWLEAKKPWTFINRIKV